MNKIATNWSIWLAEPTNTLHLVSDEEVSEPLSDIGIINGFVKTKADYYKLGKESPSFKSHMNVSNYEHKNSVKLRNVTTDVKNLKFLNLLKR